MPNEINVKGEKSCYALRKNKLLLQITVTKDIMYYCGYNLKSKYGGERLRPDDGEAGRMSRTPVGLANHPATNLIGNYQLQMAA